MKTLTNRQLYEVCKKNKYVLLKFKDGIIRAMKTRRLICRILGHKWKKPMKRTEGQEWYLCDKCLKQEYRRY